MAENYNLGSRFGLNITPKGGKVSPAETQKKDTESAVPNLFDSMTGYVAKYENVFNGEVAEEINMYSRQAMIVGMNLKAAETKRSFDMNI